MLTSKGRLKLSFLKSFSSFLFLLFSFSAIIVESDRLSKDR